MLCECYIPGSEWFGIKSTNLNNEYIAWGTFRVIIVIIFCSRRIFYKKIWPAHTSYYYPRDSKSQFRNFPYDHMCNNTYRRNSFWIWIKLEYITQLIYHLYDTASSQQKHQSWNFWQTISSSFNLIHKNNDTKQEGKFSTQQVNYFCCLIRQQIRIQ